jgi:hypothetical protein
MFTVHSTFLRSLTSVETCQDHIPATTRTGLGSIVAPSFQTKRKCVCVCLSQSIVLRVTWTFGRTKERQFQCTPRKKTRESGAEDLKDLTLQPVSQFT